MSASWRRENLKYHGVKAGGLKAAGNERKIMAKLYQYQYQHQPNGVAKWLAKMA